ncbi:MAG: hypothetical protein JXA68_11220 [Ignavibacteriales bacterium]|nr:hypothetical protein [Ignavibacteriales bacterium]
MHYLIYFFFIILLQLQAQKLNQQTAKEFLNFLILNDSNIINYIDQEELQRSLRLGITYNDYLNKFMISYDIDDYVKIEENRNCQINLVELQDGYQKVDFLFYKQNYKKTYFFSEGYFISPIYYYSRNWSIVESKYFIFYVSDTNKINEYSIKKLDDFVDNMLIKFNFNEDEIEILEKEKIFYFLCKDEEEIEKLTGFRTRGIYIIAYDYIVSIFSTHYHELVHLLVNYKLKSLNINTHPFFQEGLAVAFGGRGGNEPQVILELGAFIEKANLISYEDLLSSNNFNNIDASISYPTCGLFSYFLIQKIGIDKYLSLYKKYSFSNYFDDNILIDINYFPDKKSYMKYVQEINNSIYFSQDTENYNQILSGENYKIFEDETSYLFQLKDTTIVEFGNEDKMKYQYNFQVNQNEISIFDLQTNNLITKFATGFSIDGVLVPFYGGYWTFSVRKSIFN